MRWIRFFLKVSAVCNGCFFAGCLLRAVSWPGWLDFMVKTILVSGFILAMPMGILVNLAVLILLLLRKIQYTQLRTHRIILAFNLLSLLLEILYASL